MLHKQRHLNYLNMNDVIDSPIFIPGKKRERETNRERRTGHMEGTDNLNFLHISFKLTDLASRHIASSSHTERICPLYREYGSQEVVFQ